MSEDERKLPNYAAFIVMTIVILPIVLFQFGVSVSGITNWYFDNFGIIILFQMITWIFVFIETVISFDKLYGSHQIHAPAILGFFAVALFAQLGTYMGYLDIDPIKFLHSYTEMHTL